MSAPAKVTLTAIRDGDMENLYRWINDRESVLLNSPFRPVHYRDHAEWFDAVRRRKDIAIFAVRAAADDRLLGTCQLHSIHPIHRSAELQIRVGALNDRGRGYGKDALRRLLEHGFRDLGLNRIALQVFADNERAIRLYRNAGFAPEGALREGAFIDGEFKDILLFSMLRREWKAA